MANTDTWLADCERNFACAKDATGIFSAEGKKHFFPNSFHVYELRGEASDEFSKGWEGRL